MLHWDPSVPRSGLGTLIKRANHYAIVVKDVAASLRFYKDVLGLQQIKRPNFDRHGAWLTAGNIEVHLIKGEPAVHKGDNLVVSHLSLETDHVDKVLDLLKKMGIQYSRNVSVPNAEEDGVVIQYFIRDPDGYYVEICNCDILTKYCLGKDEGLEFYYNEAVEKVNPCSFLKLALLANSNKHNNKTLEELVPPKDQWASKVDPQKLENMLKRTLIYADIMQGETEITISKALIQANNSVPLATRILKAQKKGQTFQPPSFFVEGAEEKYKPIIVSWKEEKEQQTEIKPSSTSEVEKEDKLPQLTRAEELLKHFDMDGNGILTVSELRNFLKSLCHGISDNLLQTLISRIDSNNDGTIDIKEIENMLKTEESELEIESFFNLLDDDHNKKITAPEFCKAVAALGLNITDSEVEEFYLDFDLNGDGALDVSELKELLSKEF
jgi:Ca2+-binding EF-hand superfamily protein/catechol 2,3-dioxygenase-like lactoylglutathione lyase family enzyme